MTEQTATRAIAPNEKQKPLRHGRRLVGALTVLGIYAALVGLANALAAHAGGNEDSPWMAASGMILGFVAIPVFSVGLPFWLARRWDLPRQWWPAPGTVLRSAAVLAGFFFVVNFEPLQVIATRGIDPARFAIHFLSTMLFHLPYYPLFAVLLFGVAQAWRGRLFALCLTAAAFSLYHLVQWHFFPAGTSPEYLLLLFAAFAWQLLLYLATRSLFLVALGHCLSGAANMASEGTLHDGVDFVFGVAMAVIAGVVVYGALDERRRRKAGQDHDGFWLLDWGERIECR